MVDITTLDPLVQTQLKHDRLMYEASNGKQVNIKRMAVIVNSADPEGVIDVLHRYNFKSGKHPFYFQHTDLFHQAQKLYKSMFGLEPDIVIYAYRDDFASSIFLFANKSLIEKSFNKEVIEIKLEPKNIRRYEEKLKIESRKGIKVKNVRIDGDSINLILPNGVFPVIGALNSIDSSWRTPNFNLIFGTTEYNAKLDDRVQDPKKEKITEIFDTINHHDGEDEPSWIGNIDEYLLSKHRSGISLYSIDKFDFKDDNNLSEFYDPFNMTNYFNEALYYAKGQFSDTIVSFLLAMNRGECLPINPDQFSAFMPHFYGYDRLKSSVERYDSDRKNKFRRLYDTSYSFASGIPPNRLTCKNIIDYFLRNSIINFAALQEDPGKEILKAFKKQDQVTVLTKPADILSDFITAGASNSVYDNFLNGVDGQMEAKNKIYPLL